MFEAIESPAPSKSVTCLSSTAILEVVSTPSTSGNKYNCSFVLAVDPSQITPPPVVVATAKHSSTSNAISAARVLSCFISAKSTTFGFISAVTTFAVSVKSISPPS